MSNTWNCKACTFLNAFDRQTCEICRTPKPKASPQNEEELVDYWIQKQNLNEFGDPLGTVYAGCSPLFNETTFEFTERLDYIRNNHPGSPWLFEISVEETVSESSTKPSRASEQDPEIKETRLDEDFFEDEDDTRLKSPVMDQHISHESWGSDADPDADWDDDDDFEELIDKEIDKPDLDVETINQVEWQCVKCASFNGQFTLQCLVCNELKNASVHCDICDVDVPFMCYESHMKAHEKSGHKSPVGLAFSIISILRNNLAGIPTVVVWDFALNFVKKFIHLTKKRGLQLSTPKITYHWTPKKNINLIVDGNLKVPDGRKVLHQTDEGFFGKGIYTSPNVKYGAFYGHGSKKTILCLAICGKRYSARQCETQGKPLKEGYDMHVSVPGELEWVFFDSAQLLPTFVIEPNNIPKIQPVIDQVIAELVTSMREISYFDPPKRT